MYKNMELLFNLIPGLIFGSIAVLTKFPKKLSAINGASIFILSGYFLLGFTVGALTLPLIDWARDFTTVFVSTSSDFVITKVQKVIIGLCAVVGFVIGLRLGKRQI